jgi:sodium-dependent phosphate cotransporter
MVGADIINVMNAIFIVMGANIGTSVTNSLVSFGHIVNVQEFRLGFQGASAHSSFNLLCVLLLLPLEIITTAFNGGDGGMLFAISSTVADSLVGASAETFKSPVKVLVGGLSSKFIKINKDLIKGIAKGCIPCEGPDGETEGFCKDDSRKDSDGEKIKQCVTVEEWDTIYLEGNVVKKGFAADMGDETGSLVVLVISLVFLCVALYGIVRLLHYLVLSSGRMRTEDGGESAFVRYVRKVLGFNAYLSIFFGMVMTICVQSSSITTSALVPLVALQIISVEDMLPLTLGANIGTTCTAFLASMVTEKKSAIQIALVHFFFNIIGIAFWFPVPFMRRLPLAMAETLSAHTLRYRWFGAFYILLVFVLIPLALFVFSLTIALGPGGIALNVILDVLTLGGAVLFVRKFDKVMKLLGKGGNAADSPRALADAKSPENKGEESLK